MHRRFCIRGYIMKPFDFYLSKSDEYVPENYISISDLFLDAKYAFPGYTAKQWVMGSKTLDEMRKKTFSMAKKRFILSGAKSFASFWNGNLDAINDAGINQFTKLSAFSELSGCMIAFEKIVVSAINKRNNRIVSFGISKSNYDRYAGSLKIAILHGSEPKKVNLYDAHKKRLNDMFSVPVATFSFDGKDSKSQYKINVHKVDLYYKFERWCKLQGKTKKQGIYEAMELLLEQVPVEPSDSQSVFVKKNEFGSMECIINSRESGNVNMTVKIPASIYDGITSIIRRFNSDPENLSKPQLTVSSYVSQAVAAFNKRVPLKYSDPNAYKEYVAIKETEEYNNSKIER